MLYLDFPFFAPSDERKSPFTPGFTYAFLGALTQPNLKLISVPQSLTVGYELQAYIWCT